MLATHDSELAARLAAFRQAQTAKVLAMNLPQV
jgi:phosphoribosylcarboxyaminoimidazole (NCAIR) mutase